MWGDGVDAGWSQKGRRLSTPGAACTPCATPRPCAKLPEPEGNHMINEAQIDAIAANLLDAERARTQIPILSLSNQELTIADA